MAMIIGSGAGAGLLAMNLVKAGIPTTIIEKGPYFEPKDLIKECTKDKIYDVSTEEPTLIPVISGLNNISDVESFTVDNSNICEGVKQFSQVAKSKSLNAKTSEKAIDGLGKKYVQEGFDYALTILSNAEDIEVVAKDNKIIGVKYVKDGIERMKYSKTVILATDGLDSSILLKTADIESETIKYKPSVTINAKLKNLELKNDFPVITQIKGSGFTLYPYALNNEEISILVVSNTSEETELDGECNFTVKSNEDLDKGIELVKEILEEMKASDISISEASAAECKGSATDLVDDNLETSIKGLHICDSSLSTTDIPVMALSKKLADFLIDTDYDNNQFGKSDYGLGKSYGKMDGWWREPPKE